MVTFIIKWSDQVCSYDTLTLKYIFDNNKNNPTLKMSPFKKQLF